jgi:hypothetical protein
MQLAMQVAGMQAVGQGACSVQWQDVSWRRTTQAPTWGGDGPLTRLRHVLHIVKQHASSQELCVHRAVMMNTCAGCLASGCMAACRALMACLGGLQCCWSCASCDCGQCRWAACATAAVEGVLSSLPAANLSFGTGYHMSAVWEQRCPCVAYCSACSCSMQLHVAQQVMYARRLAC